MKKLKLLIPVSVILLIALTYIFLVLFSNSKNDIQTIYSLRTNYSFIYEEDKSFSLTLYTSQKDNLVKEKDENIYKMVLDNNTFNLNVLDIKEEFKNTHYEITIISLIPTIYDEVSSNTFFLKVKNDINEYSFDMGSISIVNKNLLLDDVISYPSYQTIDNIKNAVGINISNFPYDNLSDLKASSLVIGKLNLIKYELYGKELDITKIIPNYNIKNASSNSYTEILSKDFFIPLSYVKYYPLYSEYVMVLHDSIKEYIKITITNDNDYESLNDYMVGGVLI